MNKLLLILITVGVSIVSCSKSSQVPSQDELRECHDVQNLLLTEIRDVLIGEWELVMVMCSSNPMRETESSTGLFIEFKENGELIITNIDNTINKTTWQIDERLTNMYEVVTEMEIPEIQGAVVFCEDRVEFRLSYIDLCDHRFKRII